MNQNKLAELVLRELKVFERGQPINGEYIEVAKEEYVATLDYLRERRALFWDVDNIPNGAGRFVAVIVADRLANEFGKSLDFQTVLAQRADGRGNHMSAMSKLRELSEISIAQTSSGVKDF